MTTVRGGVVAVCSVALALSSRDARACGGCFHEPAQTAVDRASEVTDHRMVLALSSSQTTLWDQIRWAGDPGDFVWVLPLGGASRARVGVADDAFLNRLDRVTAPTVSTRFPASCVVDPGTGQASVMRATTREEVQLALRPQTRETPATRDPDSPLDAAVAAPPVVEETVGPYATLLLDGRSPGQRLDAWLSDHHYALPDEARDAVNRYTELASGWLVLRLRPEEGVSRMSPVRVTLDGYQPTLPLRMIAAGASDSMGLTLLVYANTPMHVADARDARVDVAALTWQARAAASNYRDLFARAVGDARSPAWVTESIVSWGAATAPDASDDERALGAAGDGYLTRLRTLASRAALDRDLRIEPVDATPFGPFFTAIAQGASVCPRTASPDAGIAAPIVDPYGCACRAARAHGDGAHAWTLTTLAVALRSVRRRRGRPVSP